MPVRSRLTEDFRKSGQTQEAFCKENKISIHILRYHLYKKNKHRRSIPVGKKDLFPDSVTAPFISFPGNPQNDLASQNDVDGDVSTESVTYDRKKCGSTGKPVHGHGRGTMPTHLPVKETVIEPDADTTGMEKIGEEVSWYYEMEKPTSLHIVKIIRPKYALPQKSGVLIEGPRKQSSWECARSGFMVSLPKRCILF